MPDIQTKLLPLIDLAYEAVESPNLWSELIDLAALEVGSQSGILVIENTHGDVYEFVESGVPDGFMAPYMDYFITKDPWLLPLYKQKPQSWFASTDVLGYSDLKRSEAYCDLMRHFDMEHACGSWSPLNDNLIIRFAFQRYTSNAYSSDQVQFLNLLGPHLRRSVQLYHQQAQISNFSNSTKSSSENLAIAIVDAKGCLVEGNELFSQLISDSQLIDEKQGVVCFKPSKLHNAIHAEIRQVIANFNSIDVTKHAPSFVLDNGLLEKYCITVSSFIHNIQGQRNYRALLTFKPIISQSSHRSRLLKLKFGLTDSELRVVLQLCNGSSVDEIAKSRIRSEYTVRTQLKHIYYKLGCDNQNQLVHTVLTLFSAYK